MAKVKHVLNVVTRSETGKGPVKRLRAAGRIPAVVYGKGQPAKLIYFQIADWEALQKFELNLIALKEGDKEMLALIQEVQNDFIRGKVRHIDFREVSRDEKIRAKVSVHPGHTAAAGIVSGGIFEQLIHEVEVECLPDDLPEFLEIDVAALEMGQVMHAGDMKVPEGIKVTSESDLVVFRVVDPSTIEEDVPEVAAEAADGAAAAEPELVGAKEKAEKAAAEAAAAEDKGGKKK